MGDPLVSSHSGTSASDAAALASEGGGNRRRGVPRSAVKDSPPTTTAILAVADQGVVSATNFLTGIVIGRLCTKSEYGLYTLGFSVILLAIDLQVSLISTPYLVYSPGLHGNRLRRYNGSSLVHQLILCMAVVMAVAAWAEAVRCGYGPRYLIPVLWSLTPAIGCVLFREFVRRFCLATSKIRGVVALDCWVGVLQIAGLMGLFFLDALSAGGVYGVTGAACAVTATAWLASNRSSFKLRTRDALSDFKRNWAFGRWVFASGMLWALCVNGYPWLLALFHGTAATGIWGACMTVVAVANVPLMGMQNYLGPRFARVNAAGGIVALRSFTFRSSVVTGMLMALVCCAFFYCGDDLLLLIYGTKYWGNGPVAGVLALNLVVTSVGFAYSRALFALERADVDFKVNLVQILILLTVGLWIVDRLGPLGAAWGLVVANAASSAVRCICFAMVSRSFEGGTL